MDAYTASYGHMHGGLKAHVLTTAPITKRRTSSVLLRQDTMRRGPCGRAACGIARAQATRRGTADEAPPPAYKPSQSTYDASWSHRAHFKFHMHMAGQKVPETRKSWCDSRSSGRSDAMAMAAGHGPQCCTVASCAIHRPSQNSAMHCES